MPSRRSHSKSRNGCTQCKQKHLKCDTARPICGYCTRREWKCSFSADTASVSPGVTLTSYPDHRARELDLMHQFATSTYSSLCQSETDYAVWRDAIPRQALNYDYLLGAIFAFTALHRAFQRPDEKAQWTNLALEYHSLALARFRLVLHNITSESCHAAFAFSALTMFVGFSMPPSEPRNAIQQTLLPLRHLTGITAIVHQSVGNFLEGPLARLANNPPKVPLRMKMSCPEEALRRFRELYSLTNESVHRESIHHAIDGLVNHLQMSGYEVVLWTMRSIDDVFIKLLEDTDPTAMFITVFYAVLLHAMNDRWWARDMGRQLVTGLSSLLSKESLSPAMLDSLIWAQGQVGVVHAPRATPL